MYNKRVLQLYLAGCIGISSLSSCAGVYEKVEATRTIFSSKITAVIGFSVWCCGITYWCMRLQRNNNALHAHCDDLEKNISQERTKRKNIESALKICKQRLDVQEAIVDRNSQELKLIQDALYGDATNHAEKMFRLKNLKTLLDDRSSIIACGSLGGTLMEQSFSSSSLGDASPGSPRSCTGTIATPRGEEESVDESKNERSCLLM